MTTNNPTIADVLDEVRQMRDSIAQQDRRAALATEYMDFDDIAALLHKTRDHVKKCVIHSHGFPAACQPPTGQNQSKPHPLYPASEVRRWLNKHRTVKRSA